jgi:NAD(P)H-dependent FMN reductase
MSDGSGVKVLVLLGSLRAESINRQLAELAVETSPAGVTLELFDRLGELPFYNEDIDPENGLYCHECG